MATILCRLCLVSVSSGHAVCLFTQRAEKQRLCSRISDLLVVPVADKDGFSQHICERCKRKLERLEKAAEELAQFRRLASNSYSKMSLQRGELKRTKDTSSSAGVSPDTAKVRPPSKKHLARKQLDFDQTQVPSPPHESGPLQRPAGNLVLESSSLSEMASCAPFTATEPLPLYMCEQENQAPIPTTEPSSRHKDPVQISVTNLSDNSVITSTLDEKTGKIAKALAAGSLSLLADYVVQHKQLSEIVLNLLLQVIDSECSHVCKRSKPISPFRKINTDEFSTFQWSTFISDLSRKAPMLLKILSSIITHSDHRNKQKANTAHHPGLCMAAAILLNERNREMCGVQSIISLLLFSSHVDKKVYSRLNHVGVCMSYTPTLKHIDDISQLHTIPLLQWIADGILVKFWGDNVDKKRGVRDPTSDHRGSLLHMYSILAGRNRTNPTDLSPTGYVSSLSAMSAHDFLPTSEDHLAVQQNLVVIVSRILTQYLDSLSVFSKSVSAHIPHKYSEEMGRKSEVVVLDVLMKNEAKHSDMIDIMKSMQGYLGANYPVEKRVLSGGDQLTCERQVGAQRHTMDGDTVCDRLGIFEPVTEDWHCLVSLLSVVWKKMYGQSSRDHGTLRYFQSLLNRTTVKSDVKKAVDADLEFLLTVFKGHVLACACKILDIDTLDGKVHLPPSLTCSSAPARLQVQFVERIALEVVKQFTLINTCLEVTESDDKVYNYARVLCHYSALITEFRDACAEGDGERVFRCWRLMLPYFKSSGRTKYSLEALRLQFQVKCLLSPQLAHQVLWDRFVNTRGGMGRNIPCDLYNEHVVKLIKTVISNMGANLTEKALQRAARSVSTLHSVCKQFDSESKVPVTSSAHSVRSDKSDIQKVVSAVLSNDILTKISGRHHSNFRNMRLNPLWSWKKDDTITWIDKKKRDIIKFRGITIDEDEEEKDEEVDEEEESDVEESGTMDTDISLC